jgi:hypothetical protein
MLGTGLRDLVACTASGGTIGIDGILRGGITFPASLWSADSATCGGLEDGMLRNYGCALVLALSAFLCVPALQAQDRADDANTIFRNMEYLKPLIGNWNAVVRFHERDGSITEEEGSYRISSVLDGTYLEQEVEFHAKDNPGKHHSFLIFITYNPVTRKYDSTYLYSRWALRVSEAGEYDERTKEYRTTAFIPLEDGTRDESVRTITKLGRGKRIEYEHYSRYSNESAERLNLDVVMTPVR